VIGLRGLAVAAVVLWTFTSGGGRHGGTGAQTLAMATLALTLLGQTFAMLSERRPFWRVTGSMTAPFWLALVGGVAIQVLAVAWPPLASVLPAAPLSAADWLRALGMSALALGIVEGGKTLLPIRG
jgi:magnesium-transporting ATPase (P-type)